MLPVIGINCMIYWQRRLLPRCLSESGITLERAGVSMIICYLMPWQAGCKLLGFVSIYLIVICAMKMRNHDFGKEYKNEEHSCSSYVLKINSCDRYTT